MMPSLLKRVINLIVKPRSEWLLIKDEHVSYQRVLFRDVALFTLAPLVAISLPELLRLLKHPDLPAFRFAAELSVWQGVQWYLLNIMNVAIIGAFFQRLIPISAHTNDRVHGLKISAYSAMPLWLAISFTAIPLVFFDLLAFLAFLYSFYLMYLSVVVFMDVPKKKAVGYATVSVLASAGAIGVIDTAIIQAVSYAVRLP
jgi:hypothetical protein